MPRQRTIEKLRGMMRGCIVRKMRDHESYDILEVLLPENEIPDEAEILSQVRALGVLTERWTDLLTTWGENVRAWVLVFPKETE